MIASDAGDVRACVTIEGREVEYHLRSARSARKLRIRVGVGGVDVIRPTTTDVHAAEVFLVANGRWVVQQLDRVSRLHKARTLRRVEAGTILFRGIPTRVCVKEEPHARHFHRVEWRDDTLTIAIGRGLQSGPAKALERWLRRQARTAVEAEVGRLTTRLGASAGRIYIMDQRTRWGNCSALQNLSFSWRAIMAPDYVLRYLVTHETVHLVVPDHSHKFWLTVQGLCPEAERGRQWLVANTDRLFIDLASLLPSG
jgi:hypothetical protein